MKILLDDTHCWLWMQVSPSRFSDGVRALLEDPAHRLFLSAASAWEISIKWSLGKLSLPEAPREYVPRCMGHQLIDELPIRHEHALRVSALPVFPDHRDPFDRILLAQAEVESLELLTADVKVLGRYRDRVKLISATG